VIHYSEIWTTLGMLHIKRRSLETDNSRTRYHRGSSYACHGCTPWYKTWNTSWPGVLKWNWAAFNASSKRSFSSDYYTTKCLWLSTNSAWTIQIIRVTENRRDYGWSLPAILSFQLVRAVIHTKTLLTFSSSFKQILQRLEAPKESEAEDSRCFQNLSSRC